MLDITVNHVLNVTASIPTEPTALPSTNMPYLLTEISISPNHLEPTLVATPPNTPDPTATGDSFEQCMQQQQQCFLETLAKS